MTRAIVAVALGMALSAMLGVSQASAASKVCSAEMDKLCKDVQRGEGRIMKCLQEHSADLSDKCRAYVNTLSQYTACIDDAMQFCPGMEPGTGRALACLRGRMTDVSPECKRELGKLRR